MSFILAELRDWIKCDTDRDTYQGYVFNDNSHTHSDGTFLTIEADDVITSNEGVAVYVKRHIYYLWNGRKKGYDED